MESGNNGVSLQQKLMEEPKNVSKNKKSKLRNNRRSPKFSKQTLKKTSADSSDDEKPTKKSSLSKKNIQEEIRRAKERLRKLTALLNANSESSDISSDDKPKTPFFNRLTQQSDKDESLKKTQMDSPVVSSNRQSIGKDISFMDTSFANVMSSTQIPKSQDSSCSSSDEDVLSVKKQIKTKENTEEIKSPQKMSLSKLKVSSDSGNNSKSDSDSEESIKKSTMKAVAKKSPAIYKETKQKAQNKLTNKVSSGGKNAKMAISPIKPVESFKKIDALKLLQNQDENKNNKKHILQIKKTASQDTAFDKDSFINSLLDSVKECTTFEKKKKLKT